MTSPVPKGKASLELSNAHHVCNVIRRQVLDEFPHVTFNFILAKSGEEHAALLAKKEELMRHPAGAKLTTSPEILLPGGVPAMLPVLATEKEKKLLGLMAKDKSLMSCFILIDDFENADDLRQHALMLVWHGLALIEHRARGQGDFYKETHETFSTSYDDQTLAWHNMLADTFSAVFLDLQGHKDYIKVLGKRRSLMPLTSKKGWFPEFYPYPLVLDAAEIVYEEIALFYEGQDKPMNQALEMTREIGETFDLNAMTQWSVFARAAQEMAWINTDRNVILGAAIHTCEDPYVRATAYMISEFLNIEPVLSIDPSLYNPFSDPEVSERHHRKACEDIFLSTLSQASLKNDASIFKMEAIKSHEKFALGKPVGWCGYALMLAGQAYEQNSGRPDYVREAFDNAMNATPWASIQELNRYIIDARRMGKILSLADLSALARTYAPDIPAEAFQ